MRAVGDFKNVLFFKIEKKRKNAYHKSQSGRTRVRLFLTRMRGNGEGVRTVLHVVLFRGAIEKDNTVRKVQDRSQGLC